MKLLTVKLIDVFEEAGRAERWLPPPKKPGHPAMYKILKMSYDPEDYGYWNKRGGMRLRATSKQLTCWEAAIDLLLLVDLEDRRLIWSRAMRFSWVALARMFGCHRVTIKRKYLTALLNMETQLKQKKALLDIIDKIK